MLLRPNNVNILCCISSFPPPPAAIRRTTNPIPLVKLGQKTGRQDDRMARREDDRMAQEVDKLSKKNYASPSVFHTHFNLSLAKALRQIYYILVMYLHATSGCVG